MSLKPHVPVIIGYYKSKKHLQWVLRNNLYNFRAGLRRGSLHLTPDIVSSKYLVLHGKNDGKTSKIFKLKSSGPRIFCKDDMKRLNYPTEIGDVYLVFEIERDASLDFDNMRFDVLKLMGYPSKEDSALPLSTHLDRLLEVKVD